MQFHHEVAVGTLPVFSSYEKDNCSDLSPMQIFANFTGGGKEMLYLKNFYQYFIKKKGVTVCSHFKNTVLLANVKMKVICDFNS